MPEHPVEFASEASIVSFHGGLENGILPQVCEVAMEIREENFLQFFSRAP